jgi:hypothetical protein
MSDDFAATLRQFSDKLVELQKELLSHKGEISQLRLECIQADNVRPAAENIQKQVEPSYKTLDEKKVGLTSELRDLESQIDAKRFEFQAFNSEFTCVTCGVLWSCEAPTPKRKVDSITVSSDINMVIFYTNSQSLLTGSIIPVVVKLHFSDIFMNYLSLVCTGNERIVSSYKSDEKNTYLIVRVEYKSDKTIISTQIEKIKNEKNLRLPPLIYDGIEYKCFKMNNQSVEHMTGPFQQYLYDPVKILQKANSEQDAAS